MKYSDFPVPQATFQPDSIDIKRARKKAAREAMICVSWEDGIVIDFMISCILWGCYVHVCISLYIICICTQLYTHTYAGISVLCTCLILMFELLLHTYCGRSSMIDHV
jgi:hypothetical protein